MTTMGGSESTGTTVALSLAAAVFSGVLTLFVFSTSSTPLAEGTTVDEKRRVVPEALDKPVLDLGDASDSRKMVEASIELNLRKAEERQQDWLPLEGAAAALMVRSRHTGDLDDLGRAKELLEKAFARAPQGSGPFVTLARLQMSLHQFTEAEKTLDAYEQTKLKMRGQLATALELRGDLALQRGDFQGASDLYQKAAAIDRGRSAVDASRNADLHLFVGEIDRAIEVIDQALAASHPREGLAHGWLLLRRGILDLDAGKTEEALAWFDKAEAAFTGWYLIEEHRAECLAALGKLDEAEALYRKVLEKNAGPEYLVALADVLLERGKHDEAAELASRADAAFLKQLEKHPEAMFGHALDHFLESESADDLRLAVELAEKNHALRPGGPAKVKLAMAYLRSLRADDAKKLVDEAYAQGHRSADLFATRAELLRRAGDEAGASAAMKEAELLDRRAPTAYGWLAAPSP